jgi:hypothetical protein
MIAALGHWFDLADRRKGTILASTLSDTALYIGGQNRRNGLGNHPDTNRMYPISSALHPSKAAKFF